MVWYWLTYASQWGKPADMDHISSMDSLQAFDIGESIQNKNVRVQQKFMEAFPSSLLNHQKVKISHISWIRNEARYFSLNLWNSIYGVHRSQFE